VTAVGAASVSNSSITRSVKPGFPVSPACSCGHGAATLLMARTWPRSTFTGFDLDEPSITVARARAADAGAPANIEFRVADAAGIAPGPFDVVVFFDALHDLGDPVAALRRAHELLTPGGILVAVEPWSTDRLEDA